MKIKSKDVQSNIKDSRLIDLRRKQIVDGAVKVFSEKGFHQATVREIANASGLTMGSLYNYIRTKQDILYICFDFMTTILTDGLIKAIEETSDPCKQLRAALKRNMELLYEYQDVVMFLYRESGAYDRESLKTVLAQETKYVELFEDLLRKRFQGRKLNEFRLKIAADILSYIGVVIVLRRWSLKRRNKSMEQVMDGILDFVESSIESVLENKIDNNKKKKS